LLPKFPPLNFYFFDKRSAENSKDFKNHVPLASELEISEQENDELRENTLVLCLNIRSNTMDD